MYFLGAGAAPAPRSVGPHPNSASRVIPNDKMVSVQWSFGMMQSPPHEAWGPTPTSLRESSRE
jgi:hypothetical protein